MLSVHRSHQNPLLRPNPEVGWEQFVTFNGAVLREHNRVHMFYRAMHNPMPFENGSFSMSVIGKVVSDDKYGEDFPAQNRQEFIVPEHEWEQYGCEDPRTTKFEGKFYTFYTALSHFPFRAEGIHVAVAVGEDIDTVAEKHLVTPFNAKAMMLFPERIGGKITALLTANTDLPPKPSTIALAQCTDMEEFYSERYWGDWYAHLDEHALQGLKRDSGDHIELGAAPLKTKYGWLILYSHIQNYGKPDQVFGIEAMMLDLQNPQRIIGRTPGPILVPETRYEKEGQVRDIVFPSGAFIEDDIVHLYYGGADTVCAKATFSFDALVATMKGEELVKRFANNPILTPLPEHAWEARDVFNPAALDVKGTVHLFYRAMSPDNTSVVGYAELKDARTVNARHPEPVYTPRMPFEEKRIPNGNSGCEDPRLTLIGDTVYMCYTAYNGVEAPAVALSTCALDNFKRGHFTWSEPVLVSYPNTDDKDACIFPARLNGMYYLMHRVAWNICLDHVPLVNGQFSRIKQNTPILGPRPGMWDARKVGISAPPILTKAGWLLLYHGISPSGEYAVGAALLDKENPFTVISRTAFPILRPREVYERNGEISNVVFPCGAVVRGDTLFMYYGGADRVVAGAECSLSELLERLRVPEHS